MYINVCNVEGWEWQLGKFWKGKVSGLENGFELRGRGEGRCRGWTNPSQPRFGYRSVILDYSWPDPAPWERSTESPIREEGGCREGEWGPGVEEAQGGDLFINTRLERKVLGRLWPADATKDAPAPTPTAAFATRRLLIIITLIYYRMCIAGYFDP